MLTVYGFPSARSGRVVWALEEAGVEYEYIYVDLTAGAGWQPEYQALNPGGKVPTLVHDEFVLTESAAICTYIGDHFPGAGLVPRVSTQERGRYNQWCYFALSELEQPLWTLTKHTFALPERRRVPAILDTARWEFAVATKVLAAGLGRREFIIDDHFSAADILIAHTLNWARALELPLEHDNVESYATRMLARPAWIRTREREHAEAKIRDRSYS